MVQVVAALVWDGDRFMICQRPSNKARALLWEFVGGKVEFGETKEDALIRECREELDIEIQVRDIFTEVDHIYPDITIHLTLFNATITAGTPKLLEHNDIRWITVDEISQYLFCPADKDILSLLTSQKSQTIAKIRERLFELQDENYRIFQAALIPHIPLERIIGIRVPLLRKFAKGLSAQEKRIFMSALPHKFYDENMLHGILLSEMTVLSDTLKALDDYLIQIDNWAVCDVISPSVFKNTDFRILPAVDRWLNSPEPYICRFGIVALMKYFLGSRYNITYLEKVVSIRSDHYYVNMARAWFFATALIDHYEDAVQFLINKTMDTWTHNKAIRKACESYRISEDKKDYLRRLSIK